MGRFVKSKGDCSPLAQKTLEFARKKGIIRARDLEPLGIARTYLQQLERAGLLVRSGRGIYYPSDIEATEHHSLAEAAKRVPTGIICLSSALRFHRLTTQNPWQVWMMIESGTRVPKIDYPSLMVFRASGESFRSGIEIHLIEQVEVNIYSIAKTVADCFKYRNKIGIDIAIEALSETLQQKRCTRDEIYHYSKINRVEKVIRPYMEALA